MGLGSGFCGGGAGRLDFQGFLRSGEVKAVKESRFDDVIKIV